MPKISKFVFYVITSMHLKRDVEMWKQCYAVNSLYLKGINYFSDKYKWSKWFHSGHIASFEKFRKLSSDFPKNIGQGMC